MVASPPKSPPRARLASMQHRVLIYMTCYNVLDGVTLTIRKLEKEILAAGHHVCILTTNSGDPANTHLDGVHPNRQVIFMDNTFPIPFLHDPERPHLTYSLGFALSPTVKQQIDDFEPSLIHMTVPDCTTLHIIEYARQKEIPIMGTYHSNIPEYMEHYPGLSWLKHILGTFFRHQYNFLQALFVPTPYIQRFLMDNYGMDKVTTLKVWGRGVDVEKFNPAYRSLEYRRKLGIGDDVPVVLWVGRLVAEKRPDIFANVIRRLHNRGVNFHALIVGEGPCEEEMKALPNTTFCGWMREEQLSTAYACSDVFLFPSSVETFGNVTLEAAASGLPVVVESSCSGHLVHDGENGFTANAGDEDAFFEATLALVEDAHTREEFSASSREMALSLEQRTVVQKMLENYDNVTDEFYTEYMGRHANRDDAYTHPGSFVGGKYARPSVIMLAEWIFLMFFKLAWTITHLALWFRCCSRTARKEGKTQQAAPSPPVHAAKAKERAEQAAIDSAISANLSVEFDDVELGNLCKTDPLLPADDNTATTSSSSQDSSPSNQKKKNIADCRLSHIGARAFGDFVMFTARMEGHVKDACCNCRGSSRFTGMAKRKNSSFSVSLSPENRPDSVALRCRSDATTTDCASLSTIDEAEGRVMRRAQSNLLDVY